MAKTILGIEIGNYRMKLAVCTEHSVGQIAVETVPENLVREGGIVSWEAMGDFLKEALKKNHISCKNAAIVLPEDLTYIRRIQMPAMTVDQLKVNLPYEFHDYITEDKDKYIYDYAVVAMEKDEAGVPRSMDLLAAAVKASLIEQYQKMLRRAGLKLVKAAPDLVAYQNILRGSLKNISPEDREDYAILDLGHIAARLHIYTRGDYEVTSNTEPGCEALTEIIGEAYGIDRHIAEVYKEKNQEDVWNREEALGLYNRIGVEIMRVLNFYGFNHPDNRLRKVYYCGGGARISPLLEEIGSIIEQELLSIELLFPEGERGSEALLETAAAAGITWE